MTAIGYIRRSKESTERTVSLEAQREKITAYATDHGWTLVEILEDDGISGGRRQRLERLAERVKATGAKAIVVHALDRFARDLAGTLDYVRKFSRSGVELHAVGRGLVEAETASGFIVTAVEGLAAEHYRRAIAEKTRAALGRLRAQGRRVSGHLPYGMRLAHDGRSLEPNPTEQADLRVIRDLANHGRSLRALSEELATRKILARCGRPFAPKVLRDLVRAS